MERFIIFGGAGFLGQHLTKVLLDEYKRAKILILDLAPTPFIYFSFEKEPRVEYRYGRDILSTETYIGDLKTGAAALFNLVGHISFWSGDRKKMYEINVDGARKSAETASSLDIKRYIHISSVAAIGFKDGPFEAADETMSFDTSKFKKRAYMYTKRLGEQEVLKLQDKGLDIVIVNPGMLYGPGESKTLLPLFKNIASGRLKYYPTGGTGIVDVRDAARGILAAYKYGKAGERYILNAYNSPFKEIVSLISSSLGKQPPSKPVPGWSRVPLGIMLAVTESIRRRPPDLTAESFEFSFRYRYYSSAKAERELGWRPEISLEKSINDTAQWYEQAGLL